MKKITSGKLQAIFAERDTDTILRYTNVRRFAIENGIPHILERNIILIDPAEFMRKVNPNGWEGRYEMPRLRTLKECVRLWNERFRRWQIDKHDIERLIREGKITSFKHGNRWVLNYDEVIEALREYVKTYSGHPIAKQNKKSPLNSGLARLRRFERPTPNLGGWCSILLSYRRILKVI